MLLIHLRVVVASRARIRRRIVVQMALTAHAVGIAMIERERVIEVSGLPRASAMTLAALPREVIGGARMTRLAVREAGVIEIHVAPIRRVMARAALTGIVIRRSLWQVTRLAIREAGVIKVSGLPRRRRVTLATLARIVIGRRVVAMA